MEVQVIICTDKEILELYKKLGSLAPVLRQTGITRHYLDKILKENNIPKVKLKGRSIHKIEEITPIICDLFTKGEKIRDINRITGVNRPLINKILKDNNLTLTRQEIIAKQDLKQCYYCKKDLPFTYFFKSKIGSLGLQTNCKKCRKITEPYVSDNNKVYFAKYRSVKGNREKHLQYSKNYRIKAKDKIKAYTQTEAYKERRKKYPKNYVKAYRARPEFKLQAREYARRYRERIKDIPEKYLPRAVRSFISSSVRYKRQHRTFDILGYTIHDLLSHLEYGFTEGMTWENYGRNGWHIDHIRPIASFIINSDEVLKEVWSLNNLQPLWETENCSKGSLYNGVRYKIEK